MNTLPTYVKDLLEAPFEAWKPYLLFLSSVSVTNLALVTATPKIHVYFFVPAYGLSIWSLLSISPITAAYSPYYLDYCLGMTCILFLIILPRILLLETHNLRQTQVTLEERMSAASSIWNNPRRISRIVVGHGTQQDRRSSLFLVQSLAKIGAMQFIHHHLISPFIMAPLFDSIQLSDVTPAKEQLIRRLITSLNDITSFDLTLRLILPLNWIWTNYLCLETYHSILAIIFTCVLRIDNPQDWPPLFGSPLEAYSLRRFWSKFWHSITAGEMKLIAVPISRLLGCRPRSKVDKAVVAFMVFLLSGVAHAVIAWRTQEGCEVRDVMFYVANFAAAAIEVVVVGFVRSVGLVPKSNRAGPLARGLGLVWVYLWLMWCVPKWQFPKLHAGRLRQLEMEMAVMFGDWQA